MPQVYFEKVSEHSTTEKGIAVIIWRVCTLENKNVQEGKYFYVRASKIHKSLDGEYWTDSRYLISPDKVFLSERVPNPELSGKDKLNMSVSDALYQQVQCGNCNRVNLINIDQLKQGSHYCSNCKITIGVAINKRINLKNGSKALNTQRGK